MSARFELLTRCAAALAAVGVLFHLSAAWAARIAAVPPCSAAAPLSALSLCAGDCNGDEVVTVDELLAAGNITLGRTSVTTCPASDANHDGRVTIDEVLTAANNALAGCPGASAAAWITHGPPGGSAVLTLVVDPSEPHILYAGGDGGVRKSTDGGDSWTPINSGLPTNIIAVDLLLIDPTAPETLYAAVATNGPGYPSTFVAAQGIFKSTDSGGSWTFGNFREQSKPSYVPPLALALDPAAPQTLYLTSSLSIFQSTDGAASWAQILAQPVAFGTTLLVDPGASQTLYASASTSGMFKSTDGGRTWWGHSVGPSFINPIVALAVVPTTPLTLYAGLDHDGVFMSTDAAGSWARANEGLPSDVGSVDALIVDAATPSTIYAGATANRHIPSSNVDGIFRSTDDGGNWSQLLNAPGNVYALALAPTTPQTIYAGAAGGTFRSTDNGDTWPPINNGAGNARVLALAVDSRTPELLYAGTSLDGVFKSTDTGHSWTPISNGLGRDLRINALLLDPDIPDTLYAGTADGVFKSTDGGGGWTSASNGLPGKPVLALVIGPTAPRVLYAGADGISQLDAGGVFKSTDGGGSWEEIDRNFGTVFGVTALVVDPSAPDVLYAGTTNNSNNISGAVLTSTDGGGSWTSIYVARSGVHALALDTTPPQTLYAGTDDGVFRRVGNGTWTPVDDGFLSTIGSVEALVLDPTAPQTLYAGTTGVGVFISTDGGEHWVPTNHGLPANIGAYVLALDPSAPHTLHAGTDDGVFTIELQQPESAHTGDPGGTLRTPLHGRLTEKHQGSRAVGSSGTLLTLTCAA